MIRNLKILGLALGVVFAMSAMLASAAFAGKVTAPESATLTGTDTIGQKSVLTYNANQELKCHGHYHIGPVTTFAETGGVETHGETSFPAEEITVAPTYTGCEAYINGTKLGTATVTMSGCDFDLVLGAVSGGSGPVTASLTCPSGQSVIVHVYTNEAHTTNVCTYTFGETGNKNRTGSSLSAPGAGELTLGGTTTGISASRTGILCGGTGSTTTASLTAHAMISGKNKKGEAVALSLS
jgi:hypothetical protein